MNGKTGARVCRRRRGACLRYLLATWINVSAPQGFPWGTLAVNLIGCFLIGLLSGWFEQLVGPNVPYLGLFFITGVLGGFTTFSSFALEMMRLLRNQEIARAVAYVVASNGIGIALVAAGYRLTQLGLRSVP
jgi:CrcB protein